MKLVGIDLIRCTLGTSGNGEMTGKEALQPSSPRGVLMQHKNGGNSYTCIWTGLSLFDFICGLDNERHGDSCGDSGTVWLAFASGGVVVGDDVCCYVGRSCSADGTRSKTRAEPDHCWY